MRLAKQQDLFSRLSKSLIRLTLLFSNNLLVALTKSGWLRWILLISISGRHSAILVFALLDPDERLVQN